MKTLNLSLGILMSLALASTAMAEGKGNHPCETIKKACEAAGFQKGKHKENGKGLFIDCMGKLAKGESVPGVTVSQDDVAACKAKHEARKSQKAEGKGK